MRLLNALLLIVFVGVGSGCATIERFIEGNERASRVTVQVATLKYIDEDADRADRVAAFVDEQLELLDASGEFDITELGNRVRAAMPWENFDTAETLLVNELITAAEDEIRYGTCHRTDMVQVMTDR